MFERDDLDMTQSYRVDVEKRDDLLAFVDDMRAYLAFANAAEKTLLVTRSIRHTSPRFWSSRDERIYDFELADLLTVLQVFAVKASTSR